MKHKQNKLKLAELYHKCASFARENIWLIIILAAAFVFRFLFITYLPAGLFPDEAANGLDVNSILSGDLQPFYERGNGREALFFYLLAIPVALFGRGPWQHHIVSAGFGLATVLVTYFLTKRMFGRRTAYLASFLAGISSYFTVLSRTAFRAISEPLFAALTILFLIKIYQAKTKRAQIWSAIGAGISFGLGFYTYISFRMVPFLLAGALVILLIGNRDRLAKLWKKYWEAIVAFALSFGAAFSWLFYYFITHPGTFVGRAGQVSVFNEDLNQGDLIGTVLEVFWLTLKSFFVDGDMNWRHNISGQPFLDGFTSVFFGLSLIIFTVTAFVVLWQAFKKNIKERHFYMMIIAAWFWLMLAPEVTTAEGIPHGLRLIGIIPALFILPAWSINRLWLMIRDKLRHPDNKAVIAALFFIILFGYNFVLYFGVAAGSPEYYYSFRSDLTEVSDYLNNRNDKQQTYLSLDAFSVQTVQYLTTKTNQPYQLLVPENTYQVELESGDQVVFTMSTLYDRIRFKEFHPETELILEKQNRFGEIIMLVYQQP